MKKIIPILNYTGALALLAGLVMRMLCPNIYAHIYIVGAVLFSTTQFLLRPRGGNVVMKRLIAQQVLAGILFIGAGVLMFTHHNNEWIAIVLCGALVELYTVFRISHELDKQNK